MTNTNQKEDEVLKRMLKTKPKKHGGKTPTKPKPRRGNSDSQQGD